MKMDMTALRSALHRAPVVPVLTVQDAETAGPLAEALARGGLTAIEVTLRTPAALDAIKEMKRAAPSLLVGAGTILSEGDVDAAAKAGADFLVTPGLSPALASALIERDLIALPGVSTASEAMARFEEGFALLKFFPAEAAGGLAFLKALNGPLPHLDFMPTGGITPQSAPDYLAMPNVLAVGGSWIASGSDIAKSDWVAIEDKAHAAAAMAKPVGAS